MFNIYDIEKKLKYISYTKSIGELIKNKPYMLKVINSIDLYQSKFDKKEFYYEWDISLNNGVARIIVKNTDLIKGVFEIFVDTLNKECYTFYQEGNILFK